MLALRSTVIVLTCALLALQGPLEAQNRSPRLLRTVGDAEGLTLTYPGPAVMLSDGTLVLADLIGSVIVFIGTDGRIQRRLGGRGSAPGQFQSIVQLTLLGDTALRVTDGRTRRLTTFALKDGRVLGTRVQNDPVGNPTALVAPTLLATSREDVVVALPSFSSMQKATTDSVELLGPSGRRQTLAPFNALRSIMLLKGGQIMTSYQPLDDSPILVLSGNASAIVLCDRDTRRGAGSTAPITLTRITLDGTRVTRRLDVPRHVFGRNTLDSLVTIGASDLVPGEFPNLAAAKAEVRRSLYSTPAWPPVTKCIVDRTGSTALVGLHATGAQRNWLRLSWTSPSPFTVTLPSADVVLAFSEQYIWTRARDDDEAPVLHLWAVR